eukprot:12757844-Ditylum_brightwellii.AAC.1
MNIASSYLIPALLLAADARTVQKNDNQPKTIYVLFNALDGDTEGDPLDSDVEFDGDEICEEMPDEKRIGCNNLTSFKKYEQ